MTQNNTATNNDLSSLFNNFYINELPICNYPPLKYEYKSSLKQEPKEVFKDIKDYEGHYQISNLGAVKSLKRNSEKLISPSIDKTKGYYRVCLYKNNKRKSFYVHKLVAIAFLEHKPNGNLLVVDHIDNDKTNNKQCNLQLISSRENSSKDQWRRNPTSIFTGVSLNKLKNKWESSISVNGTSFHLGYFNNESMAAQEYMNALGHFNEYSNLTFFPFRTNRRYVYNIDVNQLQFSFS
tara:strand:- start:169 stop:879 length:711 start_codon:yes stop_codon:yes gene_type:complete